MQNPQGMSTQIDMMQDSMLMMHEQRCQKMWNGHMGGDAKVAGLQNK